MTQVLRRKCGLALGLIAASAFGCGGMSDMPALGTVSGVVTLDKQPLPNAKVEFQPPDGRASVGTTDESGRYTLKYDMDHAGAKVGSHEVTITTRSEGYAKPPANGNEGEWVAGSPETVPKKYLKEGALTATVKAGRNTIDFPLEK